MSDQRTISISGFTNTLSPRLFKQSSVGTMFSSTSTNSSCRTKKSSTERAVCKLDHRDPPQPGITGLAIPSLAQLYILHREQAALIESNAPLFGNACRRVVSIALQTSQVFPSMMDSYLSLCRYVRKQLTDQYLQRDFHILIADSTAIDFAIDEDTYFAVIQQEQYRVLIFSTERYKPMTRRTHTTNHSMKLQWKSVVIRRIKDWLPFVYRDLVDTVLRISNSQRWTLALFSLTHTLKLFRT